MVKLTFKGADTLGKTNEPCAAAVLVRAQGEQMRRRMMSGVKKECFGYSGRCKCNALNQMYCETEKCKFYKTTEQFERDRRKYPFRRYGE